MPFSRSVRLDCHKAYYVGRQVAGLEEGTDEVSNHTQMFGTDFEELHLWFGLRWLYCIGRVSWLASRDVEEVNVHRSLPIHHRASSPEKRLVFLICLQNCIDPIQKRRSS
jgi:hypothetical protein